MGFGDIFDKLDDIFYKPIETICEWTKEPLRKWEHNRNIDDYEIKNRHEKEMAELAAETNLNMEKWKANIEKDKKLLEQELSERERQSITDDLRARAEIDAEIRKWNAEIDNFIDEQEDQRRDKLVESIKQYQIDLSNVAMNIAKNIGIMSLELREQANSMVYEQIEKYRLLQSEAKKQSLLQLSEIKELFFDDDKETYTKLVNEIINERRSSVEMADRFITELSEDVKRINTNIDIIAKVGMENTNKYLSGMASHLGLQLNEHK